MNRKTKHREWEPAETQDSKIRSSKSLDGRTDRFEDKIFNRCLGICWARLFRSVPLLKTTTNAG